MNPSQLNNENLPAVAHAATHIQNFAWYHPSPADHIEGVKIQPALEKEVVFAPSSTTTTTIRGYSNAPLAKLSQIDANLSIPISTPVDNFSNAKDIETGNLTPSFNKKSFNEEATQIPLENLSEDTYIDIKQEQWNFGSGAWIAPLEEEERLRRMNHPVDALLLSQWRQLILPCISVGKSPAVNTWKQNIARSSSGLNSVADSLFEHALQEKKSELKHVSAPAPKSAKWTWSKRRVPQEILDLEEAERQWRINNLKRASYAEEKFKSFVFPQLLNRFSSTSVLSNIAESVSDLAVDAAHTASDLAVDAAYTASNLAADAAYTASNLASDAAETVKEVAFDAAYLASAAAETVKEVVSDAFETAKDVASDAVDSVSASLSQPAPVWEETVYTKTAFVPLTFSWSGYGTGEQLSWRWPRTVPQYVYDLEELERELRTLKGINPILSGKFNLYVHPYIRSIGLPKTLPVLATDAIKNASHLVEKAKDAVLNATTPSPVAPNLWFEKSAESIGLGQGDQWTWNLRRVPYAIINLEEEERARRISEGVDPVLLGKHRKFVLRPILGYKWSLPSTTPVIVKEAKHAIQENAHSWSNWMGNLTGMAKEFVHDVTVVAKDSLGIVEPGSVAFVTKEEEKERARRMAAKTDPMMEARKRRVEEELLHQIKPAC